MGNYFFPSESSPPQKLSFFSFESLFLFLEKDNTLGKFTFRPISKFFSLIIFFLSKKLILISSKMIFCFFNFSREKKINIRKSLIASLVRESDLKI